MKLQKAYNKVVASYINEFEKKQGLVFDGWVGDNIGEVAVFGDFFFNFDDIRRDIDTNQPKGFIIQWYDEALESNIKINYKQYILLMK